MLSRRTALGSTATDGHLMPKTPQPDMRFFFPDSQDQVDPNFDFISEEHAIHRIRQRDDRYAHEILASRPFDGLLISKSIVDGHGGRGASRYSTGSRNRLYRERARDFFRLRNEHNDVLIMGDCGAFTYVSDDEPPYSVSEVADFYEHCALDWGVAPDHIVFGFVRPGGIAQPDQISEWSRRQRITILNAAKFIDEVSKRKSPFEPIAVAHGWSAETYADSVEQLQSIGYERIAMGGMVPLRTPDILATLEVVYPVLAQDTQLHLLGITRVEEMQSFARLGVKSFDSTSPFRQAFKDNRDNYYTIDGSYVAIKVPQVDGNASLKRAVKSGVVDQRRAFVLERSCLESLRSYDRGETRIENALAALQKYSQLINAPDRTDDYRRTLKDQPWKTCTCGICERVGIEVIIFRGSERNKRRGFHNLSVFRQRLQRFGFESLRTVQE